MLLVQDRGFLWQKIGIKDAIACATVCGGQYFMLFNPIQPEKDFAFFFKEKWKRWEQTFNIVSTAFMGLFAGLLWVGSVVMQQPSIYGKQDFTSLFSKQIWR